MSSLSAGRIKELAQNCVESMGDVFWDYNTNRDSPLGYSEPSHVATESVEAALRQLVEDVGSDVRSGNSLGTAYRLMADRLGKNASDASILAEIIANGHLSRHDASAISQLARRYGVRLLRHALALAEVLEIEGADGMV